MHHFVLRVGQVGREGEEDIARQPLLNGYARAGISFTGLGPQKFIARRMLWACFEGSAPRALEGTPIVVDGVMYVTTVNEAYALDARSARQTGRRMPQS